ncbi:uncharacterized protein PHALS_05197 [Plasmopara halstedii]|uniref:Uncharacterized protein n=1 Tax=Plasmopara halstedii TaxID=4781 RepID=A0A0P1B1N7_PLAHL|nr:uncharacterized protein PHALS_05197 [Plasmopara halstedii]CEG47869.1 hypothetical protein PHALS_05197 [Plasmopara halstedii]|eukprot:XP_024584238.1 hypothetical protein PHALS_05197 [Plasmopara halstedii]
MNTYLQQDQYGMKRLSYNTYLSRCLTPLRKWFLIAVLKLGLAASVNSALTGFASVDVRERRQEDGLRRLRAG